MLYFANPGMISIFYKQVLRSTDICMKNVENSSVSILLTSLCTLPLFCVQAAGMLSNFSLAIIKVISYLTVAALNSSNSIHKRIILTLHFKTICKFSWSGCWLVCQAVWICVCSCVWMCLQSSRGDSNSFKLTMKNYIWIECTYTVFRCRCSFNHDHFAVQHVWFVSSDWPILDWFRASSSRLQVLLPLEPWISSVNKCFTNDSFWISQQWFLNFFSISTWEHRSAQLNAFVLDTMSFV